MELSLFKKKFLSCVIAGFTVLSISGCGGGSSSQNSADAKTVESATLAVKNYSIQPKLDSTIDYTKGKPKKLIIATDGAEDRVDGLLVHYLADEINAITKGRLNLDIFFNGSMGTDTELCEGCQEGDVAFFLGSTAFTGNFVKELSAIDLPFLYADVKQFRSTMDDQDIQNSYGPKYIKNGFELLGYFDQGMREMTTNIKVQSPADIKGQKIRVMENPLHIAIWEAMGANPTPMAFSEVYMALQQGTIDAQENPFENIYANRIYEQQKYVILTNHLPAAHNLLISKKIMDSLSATDQELIRNVSKAAIAYSRQQCDARLDDRINKVKAAGTEIITLSPEVLTQLQQECSSVYDTARKAYGNEQVELQIKTANKFKK